MNDVLEYVESLNVIRLLEGRRCRVDNGWHGTNESEPGAADFRRTFRSRFDLGAKTGIASSSSSEFNWEAWHTQRFRCSADGGWKA